MADLAAVVAASSESLSTEDWVGVVAECQQLVNALSGVQTMALARLAALEVVEPEDGTVLEQDRGLGHVRLDAAALVSDALGVSDAAAGSRVEHAVRVAARLPELVTAMDQGLLDTYRASVVSEELADAPAEVCAVVMASLAGQLGSEPAGALRRRVRRVLGRVAPDLVRVRARRARSDRALRRWTHQAGVDEWSGTFPVEQSRPAWAAIDKLAKAYVREGRCQSLEQARADALMELVQGRTEGTFLVQIGVSTSELVAHTDPEGETDELVEVTGLGIPDLTHVSRAWLDSLPGAPFTTHTSTTSSGAVRRVATELAVCDPDTGALLGRLDRTGTPDTAGTEPRRRRRRTRQPRARGGEVGGGYQPPAWLAALVRARDGGCRFPGCTSPARFCDLDHVRPWPTGPTAAWNLFCLCRRHHRIKQRRGWTVRLARDGTATWTDPTGRARTTLPQDLIGPKDRRGVVVPPAVPVVVDAGTPTLPHPLATGLDASWSALEEDLELTLMGARCGQAESRRSRTRAEVSFGPATRQCTVGDWTKEHRGRRDRRRGRWPKAGDPPPF